MTTGTPGALSEFINEAPVERTDVALDGLRARAAIHVSDGGDHAAFFGTHLRGQNHEGRIGGGFQVFGGDFREHRGSKRTPPLAKFDGVVYLCIHFGIAGIGQNRAAAEGARPKFHAALKPAENFSVGQHFGGCCGGIGDAR